MQVLVFNAGSSTLKFSLIAVDATVETVRADGQIDWTAQLGVARASLDVHAADGTTRQVTWTLTGGEHAAGVDAVLAALRAQTPPLLGPDAAGIDAVAHRVVHGGTRYQAATRIDAAVEAEIARLIPLAPLHNPAALAGIRAAERALPRVPEVATFDTAFHATLPPAAYVYPVPYAWYTDWGVRRFGFHGLSHAYCTQRAAVMLGRPVTDLRLVTCHLGNGCSLAAVAAGRSIDTTMGFTPLDGLMMGTRSGTLDPGILVFAQRAHGLTIDAVEDAVTHGSGLLGISGQSSDMRTVLEAATAGDARAALAVEMFAGHVRAAVAAMAAALGGLDALVFTAGIGEHAASVRAAVCAPLAFMGIVLNSARNAAARPDIAVEAAGLAVRVLVIHTEEDRIIAREAATVLGWFPESSAASVRNL